MSKYIKKIVDLNRYTTDSEANVKLSYKTLEAISSLWVKVADNPVTPTVPDVTRAIGVQTTSRDIANYTKIVDHFLNLLMKSTNQKYNQKIYKYDFVFTSNPEIDPEATLHKNEIDKKFDELKAAEPTPSFETKYRKAGGSSWTAYSDVIFYIESTGFSGTLETDDTTTPTPTINATVLYNLPSAPRHNNPAYLSYSNTAKVALLNLCTSRGIPPVAPGSPLNTYEDYKNSIIASFGTPTVKQKKIRSSNPIEGVIPKTDDEYFIIDLVKLVNTKTAPPPGMPRENYEYILNKSGVLTWAGVSETDPSVYNPALLPYDPNKFAVGDVEKATLLNRDLKIPASMGGFILANVLALRASMIASITSTVESNFDLDGGQIAIQEMFSAFTPRQAKLFNARGLESYVANDGTVRFDVDKTMDYLKQMANYNGITQFFDKRIQLKLSKLIDYPIESYDNEKGVKKTTPYKDFIKNATYEQLVDPTIISLIRNIARQIAVEIGKLEIKLVRYQRRQRIDKINKAGD